MKKTAIIIVLLLYMTASAYDITLRRCPYSNREWDLFVPADNNGEYWVDYRLSNPCDTPLSLKYLTITDVIYGKVLNGKYFTYGVTGYSDSGFFAYSSVGFTGRTAVTTGAYCQAVIPTGHNIIQVLTVNSGGSRGYIDVNWSDGTTTDLVITAINTATSPGYLHIYTVATNTTKPDGVVAIRFNARTDDQVRILGIRSFNSSATGDPNTASSGLAVGHDIVTESAGTYSGAGTILTRPAFITNDSTSLLTTAGSSFEFAVSWSLAGYAKKWTGGTAHFGTPDANFIYHSGEFTTGPAIYVNEVAKGNAFDSTALRTVYSGNTIRISSTGFADYDKDSTEDNNEPNIIWNYRATKSGLGINIGILFKVETEVDYAYGVEFPINAAYTAYAQSKPDKTVYALSSTQTIPGNSSRITLDGVSANIDIDSVGDMNNLYYLSTTRKFYHKINLAAGTATLPANTFWILAGKFNIRKQEPTYTIISH